MSKTLITGLLVFYGITPSFDNDKSAAPAAIIAAIVIFNIVSMPWHIYSGCILKGLYRLSPY